MKSYPQEARAKKRPLPAFVIILTYMRTPPLLEQYLPTKKFAFTAGALLLSLALVAGASFIKDAVSEKGNAPQNIAAQTDGQNAVNIQTDTDGDGLRDWEEALWGTNPNDADSDGDGTRDKEEITAGRNPLIAGPDDVITMGITGKTEGESVEGTAQSSAVLPETERLAREAIATAFALKQKGTLDGASLENISASLLNSFTAEAARNETYRLDQLSLNGDNSIEALKTYGNALAKLVLRYETQTIGNELAIVTQAMDSGDKEPLQKLLPLVSVYENLSRDLAAMKVPSDAAELHLSLINNFSMIAKSIANMVKIVDDPLTGIIGIGQYRNGTDTLIQLGKETRIFFLVHRVVFGSNDAGRVFSGTY